MNVLYHAMHGYSVQPGDSKPLNDLTETEAIQTLAEYGDPDPAATLAEARATWLQFARTKDQVFGERWHICINGTWALSSRAEVLEHLCAGGTRLDVARELLRKTAPQDTMRFLMRAK